MGRVSKITKLGIGAKVIAYAQAGIPHNEIIEKIKREHDGATLTLDQVSKYLAKHSNSIDIEPPPSAIVHQISVGAFRDALLDAINEAKANYDRYRDDPKAGWAWFKHYLDTLDRMGKVVGGYLPNQQPQVNVQVNAGAGPYTRDYFERVCRESAEYFKRIEAEVANE